MWGKDSLVGAVISSDRPQLASMIRATAVRLTRMRLGDYSKCTCLELLYLSESIGALPIICDSGLTLLFFSSRLILFSLLVLLVLNLSLGTTVTEQLNKCREPNSKPQTKSMAKKTGRCAWNLLWQCVAVSSASRVQLVRSIHLMAVCDEGKARDNNNKKYKEQRKHGWKELKATTNRTGSQR